MNRFLDSFARLWDTPIVAFDDASGRPSGSFGGASSKNPSPRAAGLATRRLGLRAGVCSVTGNYRQINEDRCFADDAKNLLLIVDGMGGHRGGADASRIIVETIPHVLESSSIDQLGPDAIREFATEAIHASRDEIVRFASTRPGFESMGATLVLAVGIDDQLYVASVGDCRAYRLRGNELTRLTRDQTFVQQMVQSGQLSLDEAKAHPWRHVVLNAVGVRALEGPIEVTAVSLVEGDRLLLATDGLTDVLDDESLRQLLSQKAEPQAIAEELVQRALKSDSKDNVSCIVADCSAR